MVLMLYKEKNYTINLNYIFNNYIREYDISKANISVLYSMGVLSDDIYFKLYNADRMDRQVYIGKVIQRDPRIQEILSAGIIEYKQKFFEANSIEDSDIVSIKNDAVFVLNKVPKILNFDKITFAHKNTYTSFMRLNELEIYYGDWLGQQVIDVKGIKDIDLEIYHMEFLNIIITYLEYIQRNAQQALQYITDIIYHYMNLKLPIGVYRRFRSSNDYEISTREFSYSVYSLEDSLSSKELINIRYNFNILRIMYTYAAQVLYEEKAR